MAFSLHFKPNSFDETDEKFHARGSSSGEEMEEKIIKKTNYRKNTKSKALSAGSMVERAKKEQDVGYNDHENKQNKSRTLSFQ